MGRRNLLIVSLLALVFSLCALKSDTKAVGKTYVYEGNTINYIGPKKRAWVKVSRNTLTVRGLLYNCRIGKDNDHNGYKVGKTWYQRNGNTTRIKKRTYKIAGNCIGAYRKFNYKNGTWGHLIKGNYKKNYNRYKKSKHRTPYSFNKNAALVFALAIRNNKVVYIQTEAFD